jgi:hypothetical protein
MLKSNHREMVVFLLGGLAALGGSNLTTGKSASLPEGCERLFPSEALDRIEEMLKEWKREGRGLSPHFVPAAHQFQIWDWLRSAAQRELILTSGSVLAQYDDIQ